MNAEIRTDWSLGFLNEEAQSWNGFVTYLREVCGLNDAQAITVMRYWMGGSILRKRRGRWEITSGAYMDKENVRIALEEATEPHHEWDHAEEAE